MNYAIEQVSFFLLFFLAQVFIPDFVERRKAMRMHVTACVRLHV